MLRKVERGMMGFLNGRKGIRANRSVFSLTDLLMSVMSSKVFGVGGI